MTTTPRELEEELDVSAKTIRAFLREEYPDHDHRAVGARRRPGDRGAGTVLGLSERP